jgi:hypothetical protein
MNSIDSYEMKTIISSELWKKRKHASNLNKGKIKAMIPVSIALGKTKFGINMYDTCFYSLG